MFVPESYASIIYVCHVTEIGLKSIQASVKLRLSLKFTIKFEKFTIKFESSFTSVFEIMLWKGLNILIQKYLVLLMK